MKCSYCHGEMERGYGKKYVKLDGTVLNFCSKKCEKHQLTLQRSIQKVKWIKKVKK